MDLHTQPIDDLPMGRRVIDWDVSPDTERLLLQLESRIRCDDFWEQLRARQIDLVAIQSDGEEILGIEWFLDRYSSPPDRAVIDQMVVDVVAGLEDIGIQVGDKVYFSGYRLSKGNFEQVLITLCDDWRDWVSAH